MNNVHVIAPRIDAKDYGLRCSLASHGSAKRNLAFRRMFSHRQRAFVEGFRKRLKLSQPRLWGRGRNACTYSLLLRGAARCDDLVGRTPGQLRHVIELESERADSRSAGTHFDNQIADFGLGHLRTHGVPSGPAFAGVETEDLTPAP